MIEVGKIYLDIWGVKHNIQGFVRIGPVRNNTFSTEEVYSSCCHFYLDGKNVYGSHSLVDDLAMSPDEAIARWQGIIDQIRSVNPPDKVALVQDGIDNMLERIRFHEERKQWGS